jgi:hypothetical protein
MLLVRASRRLRQGRPLHYHHPFSINPRGLLAQGADSLLNINLQFRAQTCEEREIMLILVPRQSFLHVSGVRVVVGDQCCV